MQRTSGGTVFAGWVVLSWMLSVSASFGVSVLASDNAVVQLMEKTPHADRFELRVKGGWEQGSKVARMSYIRFCPTGFLKGIFI